MGQLDPISYQCFFRFSCFDIFSSFCFMWVQFLSTFKRNLSFRFSVFILFFVFLILFFLPNVSMAKINTNSSISVFFSLSVRRFTTMREISFLPLYFCFMISPVSLWQFLIVTFFFCYSFTFHLHSLFIFKIFSFRPLFHNPVLWAETAFLIYLICFLFQQDKEMCYFSLFIGDQNEGLFESKGKNLYDVCPRCVSYLNNALASKGLKA